MPVVIYHNPRCSKSRQTLELLTDKGLEPEIVEYLASPPSAATLKDILSKLGLEARQLMRRGEERYKELNLDAPELSEEVLIQAMVQNPILIERPIVLTSGRAALGRPPENVLNIL